MLKVLVNLNHGSDKSFLLLYGSSITADQLKAIIDDPDDDRAIRMLMQCASNYEEISQKDRRRLESEAAFTVNQQSGYTVQRLA